MSVKIKIVELTKYFGEKCVTNGLNLEIPEGQMTVIVGRSGEGKSVLLKQIIGLIEPTSGSIFVDDIDITTVSVAEKELLYSRFGYVFQFAALLDSLNVFENIGITLLESGVSQEEVLPLVREKLAMVDLSEDTLFKYPSELSGGMKKRVGLARTLINNPSIILYDEPTTGLDPITSHLIYDLMNRMQKTLKVTSVLISHDLESFRYADNVALLHRGKIRYFGSAKTALISDDPYMYQFVHGLSNGPITADDTD